MTLKFGVNQQVYFTLKEEPTVIRSGVIVETVLSTKENKVLYYIKMQANKLNNSHWHIWKTSINDELFFSEDEARLAQAIKNV